MTDFCRVGAQQEEERGRNGKRLLVALFHRIRAIKKIGWGILPKEEGQKEKPSPETCPKNGLRLANQQATVSCFLFCRQMSGAACFS